MIGWIRRLDMRWVASVLSILTGIEALVAHGDVTLAGFAPATVDIIKDWCGNFVVINQVLLVGHVTTALPWPKDDAASNAALAKQAAINRAAPLALLMLTILGVAVLGFAGTARAQTAPVIPRKAPDFSLPSAPCTTTSCTGLYAGAFFGGLGNNVNVIGNGINGSFNSGGMLPGIDLGWQYYNGKFYFGLELDLGDQFASNAALPGSVESFDGPFGIVQAKFGATLSQLSPSFTLPSNFPLTIITPYLAGGETFQEHGGTGGAGGGGVLFQLSDSYFVDVEYLNGGGAGTAGNATASQNNFYLVKLDRLF